MIFVSSQEKAEAEVREKERIERERKEKELREKLEKEKKEIERKAQEERMKKEQEREDQRRQAEAEEQAHRSVGFFYLQTTFVENASSVSQTSQHPLQGSALQSIEFLYFQT